MMREASLRRQQIESMAYSLRLLIPAIWKTGVLVFWVGLEMGHNLLLVFPLTIRSFVSQIEHGQRLVHTVKATSLIAQ